MFRKSRRKTRKFEKVFPSAVGKHRENWREKVALARKIP